MAQPPQLAKAYKPRRSTKPILETLPSVSVYELRICSLYNGKTDILKPLKIPDITAFKVTLTHVEFHLKSLHRGVEGPVQRFKVKPIRTGFGIRHAFVCNCGKGALKLYYWQRSLLYRWCCGNRHASRAISRQSRPVLQAARLEVFLNKPIWQRTRERLEKRFGHKLMRPQRAYGTYVRNL